MTGSSACYLQGQQAAVPWQWELFILDVVRLMVLIPERLQLFGGGNGSF